MKCFYHSADLDGHCSGAIIKRKYPECELIGIDYGDAFPWGDLVKGESVYMVDFSLSMEDMGRLNLYTRLTWIDHHKSAIDDAYTRGFIASEGQFLEIGKAACELTWMYCFFDKENEIIHLLGRYDVWDLIAGTLELQQAFKLHNTSPDNIEFWNHIFEDTEQTLKDALTVGTVLLEKQEKDDADYAQSCAFETEIDGLKAIAINRGMENSQLFESVYDPKEHKVMLAFCWSKDQWTCSLYSDQEDVDVSIICKSYGGGGHKAAAGFQCMKLPFELPFKQISDLEIHG